MDWEEDGPASCQDICSTDCDTREERVCDNLTGEDHLKKLMIDWGYEAILPENKAPEFAVPHVIHFILGIIIFAAGFSGASFSFSLLRIHKKLKANLLDSSGVLLCNFLVANLLLCVLQSPFSGSSAIAGRWIFGDLGCQLYAFVGFYIGIGVIFCLGLVIMDGYFATRGNLVLSENRKKSWLMLTISWHLVFLFCVPPLLGVLGRYGLEPGGTSCTIDYWHGNFRNYNKFILFVTVFAYLIPISLMIVMLVKTFKQIRARKVTLDKIPIVKDHYVSMTKVSCLLLLVTLLCWTPYALLVLWTVLFPPHSLNVYFTLIPSLCCKFSPLLNCAVVWWYVPRISAGYFYLKTGGTGPRPKELFTYQLEVLKEEKEPLAK